MRKLAYANEPALESPDMFGILRELEQGILHHTEWLKTLHRSLICKLPPNLGDLSHEAHHHCQFGQWYHGHANSTLCKYPDFGVIGEMHKVMHDHARELLKQLGSGGQVDAEQYDVFINHATEFKFKVRNLQFALINEFCSVDPLTGVCNRQGMLFKLRQEQERAVRSGQRYSICMVDFDYFKEINDKHGHLAGDEVLRGAVQFLQKSLRPYDLVFRYGGEEFLLCLPNTSTKEAETVLERVRKGFESLDIPVDSTGNLKVTASFGIAGCTGDASVEEIIARADQALFAAKNGGRNRVVVWDSMGG